MSYKKGDIRLGWGKGGGIEAQNAAGQG